jgi:hypothetical protein
MTPLLPTVVESHNYGVFPTMDSQSALTKKIGAIFVNM